MTDFWTTRNIIIKCGNCGTSYIDNMPYPCPVCEMTSKQTMSPPNYPDIFIK